MSISFRRDSLSLDTRRRDEAFDVLQYLESHGNAIAPNAVSGANGSTFPRRNRALSHNASLQHDHASFHRMSSSFFRSTDAIIHTAVLRSLGGRGDTGGATNTQVLHRWPDKAGITRIASGQGLQGQDPA